MLASVTLEQLKNAIGGEWPAPCALNAYCVANPFEIDGVRYHKIAYQVEPGEYIEAYLLIPTDIAEGEQRPAIAVWHSHGGEYALGKSESAGLAGDPKQQVALWLAQAGYITLCPDALCFEQRRDSDDKLKGADYERYCFLQYLINGKSLIWKNIFDMMRAIDYLEMLRHVDSSRIGCFGHSLGATLTWMLGPFEPRLACMAGNCCLPSYTAMANEKFGHCFSNYVPGWHCYGDVEDICGLIAPRPLHLNFGRNDCGSPIDYVEKSLDKIEKTYHSMDAKKCFSYFIDEDAGHELTPLMWEQVSQFFEHYLAKDY